MYGETIFSDFEQYILKPTSKILCKAPYLAYCFCVGLLLIFFASISCKQLQMVLNASNYSGQFLLVYNSVY